MVLVKRRSSAEGSRFHAVLSHLPGSIRRELERRRADLGRQAAASRNVAGVGNPVPTFSLRTRERKTAGARCLDTPPVAGRLSSNREVPRRAHSIGWHRCMNVCNGECDSNVCSWPHSAGSTTGSIRPETFVGEALFFLRRHDRALGKLGAQYGSGTVEEIGARALAARSFPGTAPITQQASQGCAPARCRQSRRRADYCTRPRNEAGLPGKGTVFPVSVTLSPSTRSTEMFLSE